MRSTTFVVIPAHNEVRSVGDVVHRVRSLPIKTVCVVVDDGSRDGTGDRARKAGATVITLRENTGTGFAVGQGIRYAKQQGAKQVVLLDADGQHDPLEIPRLLSAATGKTGLVVGSRYLAQAASSTSAFRHIGTALISYLIFLRYGGARVTDPTSGFRVFTMPGLKALTSYPTVFPEPEVIIDLIRAGVSIIELPVVMKKRAFGTSSITPAKAFWLMAYITRRLLSRR